MIKAIAHYFKCEFPGCHFETDRGYEIEHQGKKIKICKDCYSKIKKRESVLVTR